MTEIPDRNATARDDSVDEDGERRKILEGGAGKRQVRQRKRTGRANSRGD